MKCQIKTNSCKQLKKRMPKIKRRELTTKKIINMNIKLKKSSKRWYKDKSN